MSVVTTPLGEIAKTTFHEFHDANPDPNEDILWERVAEAVIRRALIATSGADPHRGAQLVAASVMMASGEKHFANEMINGCLALHPTEPFFVLRGQDRLAPSVVGQWIAAAEQSGTPEHKLDLARQVQESMERWAGDRKYPD